MYKVISTEVTFDSADLVSSHNIFSLKSKVLRKVWADIVCIFSFTCAVLLYYLIQLHLIPTTKLSAKRSH